MALSDRLVACAANAVTTSEYDSVGDFTYVKPFDVRVSIYGSDAAEIYNLVAQVLPVTYRIGHRRAHSDCLVTGWHVEGEGPADDVTYTLQPIGQVLSD